MFGAGSSGTSILALLFDGAYQNEVLNGLPVILKLVMAKDQRFQYYTKISNLSSG